MFKLAILVLCAVAVSLSSVNADDEEKAALKALIKPFVDECLKEFGISEDELKKAKESHNLDSVDPCFVACVFKKFGIINDKGEYDSEVDQSRLKEFTKNEARMAAFLEVSKKCESVNAEAVSDGAAGCERAVLLRKCFIAHKNEIPM